MYEMTVVWNVQCFWYFQDAGSGELMYEEGEEEECSTPTGEDPQTQEFVIPAPEFQPQSQSQDMGKIS